MKLPRGVSSDRVIRALEILGYISVSQRGSHIKMRHASPPQHTITVPRHGSIKTGTLHSILTEVARMRTIDVESIVALL